jgi:hypothetical protein
MSIPTPLIATFLPSWNAARTSGKTGVCTAGVSLGGKRMSATQVIRILEITREPIGSVQSGIFPARSSSGKSPVKLTCLDRKDLSRRCQVFVHPIKERRHLGVTRTRELAADDYRATLI